MSTKNLQQQLTKHLTDLHAIEEQALVQMRRAPKLAGDEQLREAFSLHRTETEEHERLVRERLRARDAHPSKVKDVGGMVTGHGFGMFAAFQPDTPGKLAVHAFSYEHMEEGAYDMLGTIATRADDTATLEMARQIEAQEHAMGDRLEALFDQAVEAVVGKDDAAALDKHLNTYLADVHAVEGQALMLLRAATKLAGAPELKDTYRKHLDETREHERLVKERLKARGAKPSLLKDTALRMGGVNWSAFFAVQPDTPAKLAVFAYAFEHLEIGAYELLARVAQRAGDTETVDVAARIREQETNAARDVRSLFPQALDATLGAAGS